jgi:hypothetical protein
MDAHPMTTPADHKSKLSKTLLGDTPDPEVNVPYRDAVGCIMYCHCLTRPDISYSATRVAQYQEKPRQSHWTTVKRILRYLRTTRTWGIRYRGKLPFLSLLGYFDADFGADMDDRKSRTGYAFLLGPSIVTWGSHKQSCVADSTTTSELVAMAESVKETTWLCRLLNNLGMIQVLPIQLYSDNQAAIALVKNPQYHKKTKHIDLKYFFIREYYEGGKINFDYIHTTQQIADSFTKALPRDRFERLRCMFGMTTFLED